MLENPLWFNNPKVRVFTQFKRFGYRQFNYLKDLFTHDISHGNVMPILRLGIAGVAGGTIANKSKDWMRGIASGEKTINPDSSMPEDLSDIVEYFILELRDYTDNRYIDDVRKEKEKENDA